MEINVLNNKIKEIIGNYPENDMLVLNSIFERLTSEEGSVSSLDGYDCKVLDDLKKRLQICELTQPTSPLPLSLFSSKTEFGNMLFFFFMECFPHGITITTNGKEISELDHGEKKVLFYLRLLLMRTMLNEVKIVDSPNSITKFYKLFEGDDGFSAIVNSPVINEDIFYGICETFGYSVVKNRKVEVPLVVVVTEDKTIVKAAKMIKGGETAGIAFKENNFNQILDYVNDHKRLQRQKRMRVEKTDEVLGQGGFGKVYKGKMNILKKHINITKNNYNYDNTDEFHIEDVAIKLVQTEIPLKDKLNPQYDGSDPWMNTEIYTWLQLHRNKYVHPQDFETYARMTLLERQLCCHNRDHNSSVPNLVLPGNVAHCILPIYFIYVAGGEGNNSDFVCVYFVSPLMGGSCGDIGYPTGRPKFDKIRPRFEKKDQKGYMNLCKDVIAQMVCGIDSMHNNTEYNGMDYKSFLHCDLKPSNYLWCLRRPMQIEGSNEQIKNNDIIVLMGDFGMANKLVKSKFPNQYKIVGEAVHVGSLYTPDLKPRTLEKIAVNQFGSEISNALNNRLLLATPMTEELRLYYGFSQIADFQALGLSYLYLLDRYTGTRTPEDLIDKYFKESEDGHFSHFDLMRLLVGNDKLILNDAPLPNTQRCSFISREMFKFAEKYHKDIPAFLSTIDKSYDQFLVEYFIPYQLRDQTDKK